MEERLMYEAKLRGEKFTFVCCPKPKKLFRQINKKRGVTHSRRIQEKTLKEIYFAQVRETLEKQAETIQRLK
jgi:hypothetical protein